MLLLASGAPQKHLSPLLAMTSLVALLAGLLPAGLLPLSVAQQLLPLLAGLRMLAGLLPLSVGAVGAQQIRLNPLVVLLQLLGLLHLPGLLHLLGLLLGLLHLLVQQLPWAKF